MCIVRVTQGPFTVKAGATSSVTFRNVFAQTTTFQFYVDNPLFHITKPSESIRAHKEHKIAISYDAGSSASKSPVTGRLVVSCARSAVAGQAAQPNIQWIYYLKGVATDGKDVKWWIVVNFIIITVSIICASAEVLAHLADADITVLLMLILLLSQWINQSFNLYLKSGNQSP